MDKAWSHQVGKRMGTCDSRNGQSVFGKLMNTVPSELPTAGISANHPLSLNQVSLFSLLFIFELPR